LVAGFAALFVSAAFFSGALFVGALLAGALLVGAFLSAVFFGAAVFAAPAFAAPAFVAPAFVAAGCWADSLGSTGFVSGRVVEFGRVVELVRAAIRTPFGSIRLSFSCHSPPSSGWIEVL
jgi:hypothetical protein